MRYIRIRQEINCSKGLRDTAEKSPTNPPPIPCVSCAPACWIVGLRLEVDWEKHLEQNIFSKER